METKINKKSSSVYVQSYAWVLQFYDAYCTLCKAVEYLQMYSQLWTTFSMFVFQAQSYGAIFVGEVSYQFCRTFLNPHAVKVQHINLRQTVRPQVYFYYLASKCALTDTFCLAQSQAHTHTHTQAHSTHKTKFLCAFYSNIFPSRYQLAKMCLQGCIKTVLQSVSLLRPRQIWRLFYFILF